MTILRNLVLAIALLCSGCAMSTSGGGTPTGGTNAFFDGQFKRAYSASLDQAYQASIAGCKSLGLTIRDQSKNLSGASITAQDTDREVWIKISEKTASSTEISVKVGATGDEVASKKIHEAIHSKL